MKNDLKIFKTNRIRLRQMYNDAVDFLEETYGSVGRYFSNASPLGQLLLVILNIGQLIFYYIEDSITELNILKASREESVKGLAALVGHNVTRANGATGTLKLTYTGENLNMYGDTLIIPNYTEIKNSYNNLTYTMLLNSDEIRMKLSGNNSIDVNVIQGKIEEQFFTGKGTNLQSFNVSVRGGKYIDNFLVRVFINNKEWTIYESIYDIPRNGNGCLVKTSVDGMGLDIFFGNGNFGLQPAEGETIRVEYLTTSGSNGNINMEDDGNEWEFSDSGYDISGDEVDLNEALHVSIEKQINFGSDGENIELTRLIAPKHSRSFVLANPDNYVIFLEKMNYFSTIDAFTFYDKRNYELVEDDNVVYLFLVPDIKNRLGEGDDYFTVSEDKFLLTPEEKDKIYNLIEQSGQKIMTIENKILEPIIKKYIINIALIIFEGYSKDLIKQQISNELSDYFLNIRRRDRIPKSDLIRIIEGIEGVDSVNLWFISKENELNKKHDPDADIVGLDEFGDIIIEKDELPIIRGGWEDRNGVYYDIGISDERASSINISIKGTVSKTHNMDVHQRKIKDKNR